MGIQNVQIPYEAQTSSVLERAHDKLHRTAVSGLDQLERQLSNTKDIEVCVGIAGHPFGRPAFQ